jgi:NAD kinase
MKNNIENVIIVKRPTRLEMLETRFNTKEQAKFFIEKRKVASKQKKISLKGDALSKNEIVELETVAIKEAEQEFSDYSQEHEQFYKSLNIVKENLRKDFKIKVLEQRYLPNYIFSDNDIIIVVGQDGLVANVAKYVGNLPIIGINPDTERYDGVLLPFTPYDFRVAFDMVLTGNYNKQEVTMAEVRLNDGQSLLAFNDIFIGINSHASASYTIEYRKERENHLSSGIIISTGAGSTGWLSSFFNMANAFTQRFLGNVHIDYEPFDREAENLMFVVREPFVSRSSEANIVVGTILQGEYLTIESNMPRDGIIFSDGIQSDYLEFNSGTIAEIRIAEQKAVLVTL